MQFSPEHNYSSVVEPTLEGQARPQTSALDQRQMKIQLRKRMKGQQV